MFNRICDGCNWKQMDSLVERIAYATVPPKVEYLPADRGKSLENILTELCLWGKKYMDSF